MTCAENAFNTEYYNSLGNLLLGIGVIQTLKHRQGYYMPEYEEAGTWTFIYNTAKLWELINEHKTEAIAAPLVLDNQAPPAEHLDGKDRA